MGRQIQTLRERRQAGGRVGEKERAREREREREMEGGFFAPPFLGFLCTSSTTRSPTNSTRTCASPPHSVLVHLCVSDPFPLLARANCRDAERVALCVSDPFPILARAHVPPPPPHICPPHIPTGPPRGVQPLRMAEPRTAPWSGRRGLPPQTLESACARVCILTGTAGKCQRQASQEALNRYRRTEGWARGYLAFYLTLYVYALNPEPGDGGEGASPSKQSPPILSDGWG